eukprot:5666702-Pyramimonas_sp.AAC.2
MHLGPQYRKPTRVDAALRREHFFEKRNRPQHSERRQQAHLQRCRAVHRAADRPGYRRRSAGVHQGAVDVRQRRRRGGRDVTTCVCVPCSSCHGGLRVRGRLAERLAQLLARLPES